jgi:membrane protein
LIYNNEREMMNNQKKYVALAATAVTATVATISGLIFQKKRHSARLASHPGQLSSQDWKQVVGEIKHALGNKNLPIFAAGVAFFSTLSFFPLMAASFAIAALILGPSQLHHVTGSLESYLPGDMAKLVGTQLQSLSGKSSGNVIVAAIAILFSLYGASGAVQNLIMATNNSYERIESRNFFKFHLMSLLITGIGILIGFVVIGLLLLNARTLVTFGLPSILTGAVLFLRWIIVAGIITLSLAAFYRYGPDRENPKWQWVSWGAGLATMVWLIATILFFVYAQHFANFGSSYSFFAGIIVLMIWLNISAFVVLVGAEVNNGLEKKTLLRTTA